VLGQVNSADRFKITAQVDEFYLARVATGQRATAEIDGRTYALTVAKIYPAVKDREFVIDLAFTTQPPAIRSGQTVNLRLEVGEAADSLIVANGPFREDSAGQFVFVLSPNGSTATRRPVTLGRCNPDTVEVLSGLAQGDRIVTSSYAPYLKFDRIDIHGSKPGGVLQP
jgi:HlyD family secretion protein